MTDISPENRPFTKAEHDAFFTHRFGGALNIPDDAMTSRVVAGEDSWAGDTDEVPAKANHRHGADLQNTTPVGALLVLPTGSYDSYLLADGAAVSRTTYADLFAEIGTVFGVGDGSTTFNLPNIAGPVANTSYYIRYQV